MLKQALFIFFFVLFSSGLIVAGIMSYSRLAKSPEIPITSEFQGKIVYTTNTLVDADALRLDCETRGGLFKPCGTICEPGLEMCANVCAYTCEFPELMPKIEPRVPKGWAEYRNEEYGFSLQYKNEMNLHAIEQGRGGIALIFIGPMQATGTELFDGIHFSVIRNSLPEKNDFGAVLQSALEDAREQGTLTEELATTTFAGREAASFTVHSFGITRSLLVHSKTAEYLRIDYSFPDPGGLGYAGTVERMLSTFVLLDAGVDSAASVESVDASAAPVEESP